MARLLIERGASERQAAVMHERIESDSLVPSRLCHAASTGELEELVGLLDRYPHMVSAPDYDGRTALHLAVCAQNLRAVELLLQRGADAQMRDRWGSAPLDDARRFGGGCAKELNALLKAGTSATPHSQPSKRFSLYKSSTSWSNRSDGVARASAASISARSNRSDGAETTSSSPRVGR